MDNPFIPFEMWLEEVVSHDGRLRRRLKGDDETDYDVLALLPTPPGESIFTVGDLRRLVEAGREWKGMRLKRKLLGDPAPEGGGMNTLKAGTAYLDSLTPAPCTPSTYAAWAGPCPDEYRPLLRELMAYDALCYRCNQLPRVREDGPSVVGVPLPPTPLHWSRQTEWPWVLLEAGLQDHHLVLEVGGGGCPLQYAIARRCRRLTAAEYNYEDLPTVREQLDHQGAIWGFDNITQLHADARALPYPDNWFHRVFCVSVLEHVPAGRDKAVQELTRVLKPGGVLLLTLDVALEGAGAGNNFYVDPGECVKLLGQLGMNKVGGVGGALQTTTYAEKVPIMVLLIKYTKPIEGGA